MNDGHFRLGYDICGTVSLQPSIGRWKPEFSNKEKVHMDILETKMAMSATK